MLTPTRALGALLALALTPAGAHAATRYASPSGTGDCRSIAGACGLTQALNEADAGDTVRLAPGEYGTPAARIGAQGDTGKRLTILGAGAQRTRVSSLQALTLTGPGSAVSDLAWDTTGTYGIDLRGSGSSIATAARVRVTHTGSTNGLGACAVGGDGGDNGTAYAGGAFTDAVCVADRGDAVFASNAKQVILDGVTAVTRDDSQFSFALRAKPRFQGPAIDVDVHGAILIARGGTGLRGSNGGTGDPGSIDVDHSYVNGAPNVDAGITYTAGAGNLTSAPAFRDTDTYRPAAGSSALDAAVSPLDVTRGARPRDAGGNARVLGARADVGGLERVDQVPAASTGPADELTETHARVPGGVEPRGGSTVVELLLATGAGELTPVAAVVQLDGDAPATPVAFPLDGLAPGATYRYQLRAVSDGGQTLSDLRSFTTATPPPAVQTCPDGRTIPATDACPVAPTTSTSTSEPAVTLPPVGLPPVPVPLACSGAALVLTDVHLQGGRVVLSGLARPEAAGRSVTLSASGGGAGGSATVAADGSFATTLPAPAAKRRPAVRYQASLDGKRSAALKLVRQFALVSQRAGPGGTRIVARVSGVPRGTKVVLARQLSCTSVTTLQTRRVGAGGVFSATLPAPTGTDPIAYYRASVARRRGTTFTLPIVVRAAP